MLESEPSADLRYKIPLEKSLKKSIVPIPSEFVELMYIVVTLPKLELLN